MSDKIHEISHAISVANLNVSFGGTPALSDVCLDVAPGEFLGIMGPNGGGKTTLLKSILGLIKPDSGSISVLGNTPLHISRAKIGYVPQFSSLNRAFPITAREAVLMGTLDAGVHMFFRYTEAQKKAAASAAERVGISHLAEHKIAGLSGGEFQRLLIARALAGEPRLLLLDEPTASVDPASREQIFLLLERLNKEDKITIILVTHDLSAVSQTVRSIACLNRTLVYHGEPKLTQNVIDRLYGCPVDLIAHGIPHRVLGSHGECGCDCEHEHEHSEKHGDGED